uniref:G protein-coupled receptor 35 n=2 Tax=Ailuropoda melanoleuca TaxID=9646 RepID=A0A7N5JVB6_AILME
MISMIFFRKVSLGLLHVGWRLTSCIPGQRCVGPQQPPCQPLPFPACPPHPLLLARSGRTMNNSTCLAEELTWPPSVRNVLSTYTAVLLGLGLLLNGLALWVFCCRMRRWTETRVYMVNLAAADFCLLCALPFFLRSLQARAADTLFCQLSQGVYLANRYMSISLVTAIAVDRYVAVRHPLRARGLRSPRQAAAVCAALWVLVASSLGLRWALGVREGGFCFSNVSRQSANTMVFSLLGFFLPLPVLVLCSVRVATALGQRPTASPDQAEATRRAIRMVWANLAVFVVCFLPFHVVLMVRAATSLSTPAVCHALLVTGKLSDANCCLDAVCYYVTAKEFQEASSLASVPTGKARRNQNSLCVTLA